VRELFVTLDYTSRGDKAQQEIAPAHVDAFRRDVGVGQIPAFLIRHERFLIAFYMQSI
jgi:hypothetical protein